MNPVGKLCFYRDLVDGSVTLEDVALMNDTLAMRADNELIAQDQVKRGR